MNSYKLDYTKIKTIKDVVLILKAMNIMVSLPDGDIPDAFQIMMGKKMLIKNNEDEK